MIDSMQDAERGEARPMPPKSVPGDALAAYWELRLRTLRTEMHFIEEKLGHKSRHRCWNCGKEL
jgi:hypothetical protein